MGNLQSNRVDRDDLPPHPQGIVYGRAGAASPNSIINCQQQTSGFHQPVVSVDYTAVMVCAAYIF